MVRNFLSIWHGILYHRIINDILDTMLVDFDVPHILKDLPEDAKGDLERVSKLAYIGLFKEDVQLVFTDGDIGDVLIPWVF